MTLYDTIYIRRSVRKYKKEALDNATLADIQLFIDETIQLDGQSVNLEIVSADKVKNAIAPHYIFARCAVDACAYMNVGYVLQNVDLYIQGKGYGSLWLGMGKQNEPAEDFCIMLAFGKTDIPPRRDVSEFKRASIDEISNKDNLVAQAARLAPSAVNSQPWKLDFSEGKVTVRYFGRGITALFLKKKLNKIDLGIVTRHIEVALLNEGKSIQKIIPIVQEKNFALEIFYR